MNNYFKICVIGMSLISLSGCMTFSAEKLAELEAIEPKVTPRIEESIGDFTFHLDGGGLVSSNKAGRLLNNAVLENWEDNDYISSFEYVEKEKFTGEVQYNLTLEGKQKGKSSVGMQVLSGLTLFIIPHSVETSYDLVYILENVNTGKIYKSEVSEGMKTVSWLLFFPAFPFSFIGASNTYENIAEHVYQDFVRQGAFSAVE